MTRAELRERITPEELTDWEVLEWLDPWGQKREDHRAALLATVIANAAGSLHPSRRPWKSEDFLLEFVEVKPKTPQTAASIEKSMVAWARGHNARLEELKKRRAK